jgi:peptidoglycan/xylan/chitin deacetylase (PgdA/CDA1 family)
MTQTIERRSPFDIGGPFPYVLMYHSVEEYTKDPYLVTVDPSRLEHQLQWLHRRGLKGASMRELLRARRDGDGRRLVGLTFDDGYADFVHNVLPALLRYGFTATVFVLAGRLGGHNVWDPEGPRKDLMTSVQVRQVADSGMEIGSHGMRHRRLSTLDEVTLVDEIARSRAILRDISGQDVSGFCYPYGDLSSSVVDLVRYTGYDYGCAIWRSQLSSRHALPRTYVGDKDQSLRLFAKQLRHKLAERQGRLL